MHRPKAKPRVLPVSGKGHGVTRGKLGMFVRKSAIVRAQATGGAATSATAAAAAGAAAIDTAAQAQNVLEVLDDETEDDDEMGPANVDAMPNAIEIDDDDVANPVAQLRAWLAARHGSPLDVECRLGGNAAVRGRLPSGRYNRMLITEHF